jgi:hypothetical protein
VLLRQLLSQKHTNRDLAECLTACDFYAVMK